MYRQWEWVAGGKITHHPQGRLIFFESKDWAALNQMRQKYSIFGQF